MPRQRPVKPAKLPTSFVAIDFETADHGRDSACAVALVKVVDQQIIGKQVRLIRPPRPQIVFSYIHGITWADVQNEPTFEEVWPDLEPMLEGATAFYAHNAGFDRGVLHACCLKAGLTPPTLPFLCTVQLARKVWNLFPTKLPDVCRHLNIDLRHHQADSDAEACAKIVIEAALAIQRRNPTRGETPKNLFE